MTELFHKIDFSGAKYELVIPGEYQSFKCFFYPSDRNPPKGIGEIAEFLEIWKSKCINNRLPAWDDFSFESFKGWHSRMRLIKCGEIDDKPDAVLIVGEEFAKFWGRDSLSEQIRKGKITEESLTIQFPKYIQYLNDRHYTVNIGRLPAENVSFQSVLFLDLPLSNNGKDVTHAISAITPIK